jgi:hypothetical protein
MDFSGQNENPIVFDTSSNRRAVIPLEQEDDNVNDEIDSLEVLSEFYNIIFAFLDTEILLQIFDLIRDIFDPEHPLTLEALNVLALKVVGLVLCEVQLGSDMKFNRTLQLTQKQATSTSFSLRLFPTVLRRL